MTRTRRALTIGWNIGMAAVTLAVWLAGSHGVCHGYTSQGCSMFRSQAIDIVTGATLIVWALGDVVLAVVWFVTKT